jgi:hypothetical protein
MREEDLRSSKHAYDDNMMIYDDDDDDMMMA